MATQFGGHKYAFYASTSDNYTLQGQTFYKEGLGQPVLTNDEDFKKKFESNGMVSIFTNPEHMKVELEAKAQERTKGLLEKMQEKFGIKISPEDAKDLGSMVTQATSDFVDDVRSSGVDPSDMDVEAMLLSKLNMEGTEPPAHTKPKGKKD
jgi:hypothetical protein